METAYINDGLGNHQIDDWIGDHSLLQTRADEKIELFTPKYAKHFNIHKTFSRNKLKNYEVPVS